MYIAIADSSVGDRKQMERLLERESDKRISTTGVFYIETFGSSEALLNSPSVYDAYFLDVTDKGNNSYDIATKIRNKGILSPIVYCISSIDYHNCGEMLANSVFINKPIKVAELSLVLDQILKQKQDNLIPTIEFRDSNKSFYLEEKEIIYMTGGDYSITIMLSNGTVRTANGFIENIWNDVSNFDSFLPINSKTIINARYVKEIAGMSIIMTDGVRLKMNFMHRREIVKKIEQYKS